MDINLKVLAFLVDGIQILMKKIGASKGWITIGDWVFEMNTTGCEIRTEAGSYLTITYRPTRW